MTIEELLIYCRENQDGTYNFDFIDTLDAVHVSLILKKIGSDWSTRMIAPTIHEWMVVTSFDDISKYVYKCGFKDGRHGANPGIN
jgi:cbb3-type cytochrome oxidase subunit 1